LAAGLIPDLSLRRSLLSVWCRDRSLPESGTHSHSNNDPSDSYSDDDNGENGENVRKYRSSTQKAEDLLARISVVSAARSTGRQLYPSAMVDDSNSNAFSDSSNSIATQIIAWNNTEAIETLLPHPSIYLHLATAWKEEKDDTDHSDYFDSESKPNRAVKRAKAFLRRVKKDIDLYLLDQSQAQIDSKIERERERETNKETVTETLQG
jgi:hypothetical protein